MLCKVCNEIDEGAEVVICSYCVQKLLNWEAEKALDILRDLAGKLKRAKNKTQKQKIKDKIKWIRKFKGV